MDMLVNNYRGFSDDFKKLYGQMDPKLLYIEGISPEHLDVSSVAKKYFSERVIDISIDDNANHLQDGLSFGNYISELAKSNMKLVGYHDLYTVLKDLYGVGIADQTMESLWNGDLYFHDSTAIQVPYCWAVSVSFILFEGNFWGQLRSYPPKRARSFIDQVKEVIIEIAQQVAGAVAIGDLFVCYSYFIQKDNLDLTNPRVRKEVENDFQSFVHTLNKKLRPSHQSPFTNVSIFDRANMEILFKDIVYPDGSHPNLDIVEEVQRIFCDWFCKGDPTLGMPYRFPVTTLNLRVDEHGNVLDQKALDYFSALNTKFGGFNIYVSSGNKVAMCCRFSNDFDLAGADSFGNGGLSIGSHRVVTINLARIGHKAQTYQELIDLLHEQLEKSKRALLAHRKLLEDRIAQNFLPFFRFGTMSMSRLFSTFGINGVYECLEELGQPIGTEQGKVLAKHLLEYIKTYATECMKETGYLFNVEQVPAESLAVKFAEKDRHMYGMDYPLYANQFIPLWVDCDIVDRISLDGTFSKVLTGGGISHLNIAEKITDPSQMKKLIQYAIKTGCEHFAVNYSFSRCVNEHTTIAGQLNTCPMCAAPIAERYTRIIGYLTPVSSWNRARQQEYTQRVFKKQFVMPTHLVPNPVECAQTPVNDQPHASL